MMAEPKTASGSGRSGRSGVERIPGNGWRRQEQGRFRKQRHESEQWLGQRFESEQRINATARQYRPGAGQLSRRRVEDHRTYEDVEVRWRAAARIAKVRPEDES